MQLGVSPKFHSKLSFHTSWPLSDMTSSREHQPLSSVPSTKPPSGRPACHRAVLFPRCHDATNAATVRSHERSQCCCWPQPGYDLSAETARPQRCQRHGFLTRTASCLRRTTCRLTEKEDGLDRRVERKEREDVADGVRGGVSCHMCAF